MSVLRVRAKEKGLRFAAEWPDGVPAAIPTDPVRLRQLLINLAGNAIKFTDSGSVRIVARIRLPLGQADMAFYVIDSGIGIFPDKLDTIFEPFVQEDNSVTRRLRRDRPGAGHQPPACGRLGGELTVQSEPGKGSTFTATIDPGPLEGVEILEGPRGDAVSGNGTTLPALPQKISLAPAKILLVEDGGTNRKLISLVLRRGAR